MVGAAFHGLGLAGAARKLVPVKLRHVVRADVKARHPAEERRILTAPGIPRRNAQYVIGLPMIHPEKS
jgi:hypothetical protein